MHMPRRLPPKLQQTQVDSLCAQAGKMPALQDMRIALGQQTEMN
jgi:hypothetical protein